MDGQQVAARIIREYEDTPNDMNPKRHLFAFAARTRPPDVLKKGAEFARISNSPDGIPHILALLTHASNGGDTHV